MNNKYKVLMLLISVGLNNNVFPQADLSDANLVITNFAQQSFEDGTNIFSSGTANRVKMTLHDVGTGNTSDFSPAQTVTCDGTIGSTVVKLSYYSQPANYSYIQIENAGTANITHVAFRGWDNIGAYHSLTYGYSVTTEEEEEFMVPPDSFGEDDTPLAFASSCSVGFSWDNTEKISLEGAKYIRLSSNPYFPGAANPYFSGNTDISIWGIYIWTDDDGIPSSVKENNVESLSLSYQGEYILFSQQVKAEVFDVSGKKVWMEHVTDGFTLESFRKGIYIIRAESCTGEILTQKIIR